MRKQSEAESEASTKLKSAEIAQQVQRSQWLVENKGALDEYNRRIESLGVFSDGLRRF